MLRTALIHAPRLGVATRESCTRPAMVPGWRILLKNCREHLS